MVNKYASHVQPFPDNPECYKSHGQVAGFFNGDTFSGTGSSMDVYVDGHHPPEKVFLPDSQVYDDWIGDVIAG